MNNNIKKINRILPQIQCQLCTYKDCKTYATAIVKKKENIDKCRPGGIKIAKK